MVFSSLLFVFLFLTANLIVYFKCGEKNQNKVMLIFSLVFYAWGGPKYLVLLVGETFVSWFTAKKMAEDREQYGSDVPVKKYLVIECVVLLGLLCIFKYLGFILGNVHALTGFPKSVPQIALPIGISFYTFQLISYVVDVYWGKTKAQPVFWKLLLYSSLFHQCIAGPIVRYQTIADEIDHRKIKMSDVYTGVRMFSLGLAKKAILANSCAAAADSLLPAGVENLKMQATCGMWLGMIFYMLQIYLDFSAYSDMAIGMGRMIGFHYDKNFNYPYIAGSVQDFWRRWHISLSTFFRDYVYIPLGGNRVSTGKWVRNMAVVWFLTGLWHGASWNYIFWGLWYLFFLLLEKFVIKDKMPKAVGHVYTLMVVLLGWVIFKFESLKELGVVFGGMFGIGANGFTSMNVHTVFLKYIFFLIFAIVACTPLYNNVRKKLFDVGRENDTVFMVANVLDMITPALMLILSTLALVGASYNPFLYFQF